MGAPVNRAGEPFTAEERKRAIDLALTWPTRQFRHPVPPPTDDAPVDWSEEYERSYGVADYDGRRGRLKTVLGVIESDQSVDHRRVLAALSEAKRAEFNSEMDGWALDFRREHAERLSQARRGFEKAISEIDALRREMNPDNLPIAAKTDYQAILASLQTDPLLQFPGPHRRQGGGRRPARPWIDQARREAMTAGITRALADSLLFDIGLVQSPKTK